MEAPHTDHQANAAVAPTLPAVPAPENVVASAPVIPANASVPPVEPSLPGVVQTSIPAIHPPSLQLAGTDSTHNQSFQPLNFSTPFPGQATWPAMPFPAPAVHGAPGVELPIAGMWNSLATNPMQQMVNHHHGHRHQSTSHRVRPAFPFGTQSVKTAYSFVNHLFRFQYYEFKKIRSFPARDPRCNPHPSTLFPRTPSRS